MKYTLHTNGILKTENFSIDLDDRQVFEILTSIGIQLFICDYNSEYYFIEASDEQIEKLKTFTFVEWFEPYNEDIFKFSYIVDKIIDSVDELEYENTNNIEYIEKLLKELKTIKKVTK